MPHCPDSMRVHRLELQGSNPAKRQLGVVDAINQRELCKSIAGFITESIVGNVSGCITWCIAWCIVGNITGKMAPLMLHLMVCMMVVHSTIQTMAHLMVRLKDWMMDCQMPHFNSLCDGMPEGSSGG